MELMQNWKVKLQTPLAAEIKVDGETGVMKRVYRHTQYVFTLAEALEYIGKEKWNFSYFGDMMLHNIVLRDAMRCFGVKKVIEQIKEWAPASKNLENQIEDFQNKYSDDYIGNLDIQVYSVAEDFQMFGRTLHGLNGILEQQEKSEGLYVGQLLEHYPCFDSEDYATENRYYQNYIIRENPITENEMQRFKELPSCYNYKKINERVALDMLPMVYYDGDGRFMLVATCREV